MAVLEINKPGNATQKTSSKVKRGRSLPVKRSINLAGIGEKPIRLHVAIPAIVLIVAAAAVLSKFAVVDRLIEVSNAQREAAEARAELDATYKKIEEYGELEELYAHYTYSDMTEEELLRVDRVEVVSLIKRIVMPRAAVYSWSVSANQLTVNVTGNTLQEINLIAQKLEEDPLVDFCTVITAATDNIKTYAYWTADDEYSTVDAQIIAYLTQPLEGGDLAS